MIKKNFVFSMFEVTVESQSELLGQVRESALDVYRGTTEIT